MQHWIPRSGSFDRAALGGTAVLSALTLQTAFAIPTHSVNLGIVFLLASLAFHFLPLVATVFGRKFSGTWDEDFHHAVRKSVLAYLDDQAEVKSLPSLRASTKEHIQSMRFVKQVNKFSLTQITARVLGLWAEPVGDLFAKRLIIPLYLLLISGFSFLHAVHWSGRTYMWMFTMVPVSWLLLCAFCFGRAFLSRGLYLAMLVGVHPEKMVPKCLLLEYLLPSFGDSRFRRDCLKAIGAYQEDEEGNPMTPLHSRRSPLSTRKLDFQSERSNEQNAEDNDEDDSEPYDYPLNQNANDEGLQDSKLNL